MPRVLNSRRVMRCGPNFNLGAPCPGTHFFPVPAGLARMRRILNPVSQDDPMKNEFQHFDDVQQYISVSWDHLTRSLDKCKTYEDQKIGDEPYLYFPADFQSLPAFQELVKDCRVRVERLPEIITQPRRCAPEQNLEGRAALSASRLRRAGRPIQ